MNTKQQYKEAYRIARILNSMFQTAEAKISFYRGFTWNFSEAVFMAAIS